MAEIYVFKITIIGKGGHGSDPKLSNNPITPSVKIYLRYLDLLKRLKFKHKINSTLPFFNAGSASNVVPDKAFLQGTFRSLEKGVGEVFKEEFENIVKEEC